MEQPFSLNSFMGAQSEIISIPDRMVGLIIGKGGEQITTIQTESDCKVQFSPDSNGMSERSCTLTGSPEAIQKAKELISRIMMRSHDMIYSGGLGSALMADGMQDGGGGQQQMIEMMIPGNKAGIIIGKGGDTIKQLQERAGVRMVIIQDSNTPTSYGKPLRITGDRVGCQRARDMVLELLAEKEIQNSGGSANFASDYSQRSCIELPVPRLVIGIVIGKGGEMIKKIEQESGARLQFKPDDEMGCPDRICSISGTQEQIQGATNRIHELVENSLQRQGLGLSGSNWSQSSRRNIDGMDGRPKFGDGGIGDETTYGVPADKCGLVIGKGGETIREICRQSGAHVELSRDQSFNSLERVFRIQGTQEQIRQAIQLISDKAGIASPNDGSMIGGIGLSGIGLRGINTMDGIGNMIAAQPAVANIYGQLSSQLQQQQPVALQQFAAVQAPSYQYQQYVQPTTTDLTQNKQVVDANTAAWAAYYTQYYGQLNAAQQPAAIAAAVQQQQQQPVAQSLYGVVLPSGTVTPQPTAAALASLQPQQQQQTSGSPDYTAAWAEYYRAQGLHQQAQAILMQSAAASLQHQQ